MPVAINWSLKRGALTILSCFCLCYSLVPGGMRSQAIGLDDLILKHAFQMLLCGNLVLVKD